MSMTGEVHIVCENKYIQLFKKSLLFKETTFIVFSRYKIFTSDNIYNNSFAQDKSPPQAMEEHSESTDDKGKGNIIVSYQQQQQHFIKTESYKLVIYLTANSYG